MKRIIKRLNFHFRSDAGYALIVMMIAATVLLISLTTALPSVYQEGQREREAELIFRGNEYARAIYLFHRQFNRYPSSIKELLHTNNMSFLRHAYRDPVSANGKWRFIHASAAGAILDSWTLNLGGPNQTRSLLGQVQPAGTTQPLGAPPAAAAEASNSEETSTPGGQKHKTPPECKGKQSGPTSSFFSDDNLQGAFIAGVASCSDRASIRIWNKHDHYDEWEFIGITYLPAGLTAGSAGAGQQGQGQGQSEFGTTPAGSNGLPSKQNPPQIPPLTDQPLPSSGDSAPQ